MIQYPSSTAPYYIRYNEQTLTQFGKSPELNHKKSPLAKPVSFDFF
jgi:hypothetical protein